MAAFLVAISRTNRHEGRDPNAIPDSLTCGFVADLLGFPIATLASLLKILEECGLVAPDSRSGLLLKHLPAPEKLARALRWRSRRCRGALDFPEFIPMFLRP